ncbi:MAG TPA: transglycosylase domain-containing protein [Streptosporangiaceae bacterium]|nr:transglycosylase domain-containing protein [Streptosporangiaceae bacterium]
MKLQHRGKSARHRPSARTVLQSICGIAALSVVAGLLAGGMALTVAGMAGIATSDAVTTFNNLPVPDVSQLPARSEIIDSRGHLIAYYYPNHIYRVPVSYSQIAPTMREAIVAIEDARFYRHGAIDIHGTMRAIVADLTSSQVQGGSTLAQQYVKNALLLTAANSAEQRAAAADDLGRKIRELRIAANVEHDLTPDQLLAAYLNVAYFANEAYGIEVAAERYFGRTAATLTLPQSAMLAGMVQNPAQFNPVTDPVAATQRRNVVLARMAKLGYISKTTAERASLAPPGVHFRPQSLVEGCPSATPASAAWFCDYVIAELRTNPAYSLAWHKLNTTGGLRIYTTLNPQDQTAAQRAVNFMLPPPPSAYNPGQNAAAEVLIRPGTGAVEAIAVDRPYGSGRGQDSVDYAVDTPQDGGLGVQTGSSSKLFTLITALKRGTPFGFSLAVSSPAVVRRYSNCNGKPTGSFPVANAEGAGHGTYSLYTGTTESINVFYAKLEQRVGLCNVVRTAVSMGVHRADGASLLRPAGKPGTPGYQPPADDVPSFTLGSVDVSPMTMAAAYASVAAGGIYCRPVAIARITATGQGQARQLPVASPGCHRVFSAAVAAAATYILRGVLTSGTAKGDSVTRKGGSVPQAGKTGTANSFEFAAFGGYTPKLAGFVSEFNPTGPVSHPMVGKASCYRAPGGGKDCPGSVFGANAGQIWQLTFESADLGRTLGSFRPVPRSSAYFRAGTGQHTAAKAKHR